MEEAKKYVDTANRPERHGVRYFCAFASSFVSATEFSMESNPTLEKNCKAEGDITGKEIDCEQR